MPNVLMSNSFENKYKKKKESAPEYIIKKAKEAISELTSTNNPESCGVKKRGKLGDYYSIDLTSGHRILYRVIRDSENITIQLERICDHKNVYGKD